MLSSHKQPFELSLFPTHHEMALLVVGFPQTDKIAISWHINITNDYIENIINGMINIASKHTCT